MEDKGPVYSKSKEERMGMIVTDIGWALPLQEACALFVWACLTDKTWLKVLLADLV